MNANASASMVLAALIAATTLVTAGCTGARDPSLRSTDSAITNIPCDPDLRPNCDQGTGGGGNEDGLGGDDGGDGNGTGGDNGGDEGHADLPYDAKLNVGDTFQLTDAFLEKGPAPQAILSVEMDGSTWRLTELQTNTVFTVEQADCDHEGNRGSGRDRAVITWQNSDGSTESDHLDLRYCEN